VDVADQIEAFLLERRDWVPSAEICKRFDVTDRRLRQVNGQPGLCSDFAVSGDRGFKHVALASTREWLHFKHRIRRHGIGELVRIRDLGRRRQTVTRAARSVLFEADSPQAILPI